MNTISFLLPHVQLYGGIRRILEIANRLQDRGHSVVVYHTDGSRCDWMTVHVPIKSRQAFLESAHEIAVYIFHEDYEAIKTVKAKTKWCYNLNLYDKRTLALPGFLTRFIDRRAFLIRKGLTDPEFKLMANATDTKDWVLRNFGRQMIVVLGAVDLTVFHHVNVPKDDKIIKVLYLGSNKYWKGTPVIEQAVDMVRKKYPNVVLEGFHDKLKQGQLAEFFSAGDVFVDAQYWAGWNNPLTEAMACEVPVICGDIGPNRDVAIPNETALVVPVHQPMAYAEAIIKLIEDRALGQRLAAKALARVKEFTWDRTTTDFENALNHANR